MKRILIPLVAALVLACSSDGAGPVTPPADTKNYVLTNLSYEDAVPGAYVSRIDDSTFMGGPAVLAFGTNRGELRVATVITALFETVLETVADSVVSERVQLLPAGTFPFQYTVSSDGTVSLSLDVWFNGGTLSDSAFTGDFRQCYNDDCSDHVFLSFVWVRQQ